MRRILIPIVVLLLIGVGWYVHEHPSDYGTSRFYANETYHFEALRVLNDTSVVGGDPNEVLQTIAKVKAADADGWYDAWMAEGDRLVASGATHDRSDFERPRFATRAQLLPIIGLLPLA